MRKLPLTPVAAAAVLFCLMTAACGRPGATPERDDDSTSGDASAATPRGSDADADADAAPADEADLDAGPEVADGAGDARPGPEPDARPASAPPATDAGLPTERTLEPGPLGEESHTLDTPFDRPFADVRVSEDGARVAFRLAPAQGERGGALYVVEADLPAGPARLVGRNATNFEWSPSGAVIVWQRATDTPNAPADTELLVHDDESRTQVTLEFIASYMVEPAQRRVQVTADGAIVYGDAENGLRLFDRQTGTDRRLSDLSVQAPILSRTGDQIAFIGGNIQGPLFVYDRRTGLARQVAEQAVIDPVNQFDANGSRIAVRTFREGRARLERVELATDRRVETALDGAHFTLSPDWEHVYYWRDTDPSLPYGTLCEWDFATGVEATIDDGVRGPVVFADGGRRVFYRDDWQYHVAGGSPSDLRLWSPAARRSLSIAEDAYAWSLLDTEGSAALVIHQDSFADCASTLYETGGARRQALPGCWLLGTSADGAVIYGAYADGHYGLHRVRLWSEDDPEKLASGITQAILSPDGATLAYVAGAPGAVGITVRALGTGETSALTFGADEAALRAVTDRLVVTTARHGEGWTLGVHSSPRRGPGD